MVADPPELGCRCKSGYYDANIAGPLLCYKSATPLNSLYPLPTEDDQIGWARQKSFAYPTLGSENDYCQECPADCVDCLYPGYAGRPMLKPGYSTANGPGWFEKGIRVVFECPEDKFACLGETAGDENKNISCGAGYTGVLCAICVHETHSMSHHECLECQDWTGVQIAVAVLSGLLVVGLIAAILYILGEQKKQKDDKDRTTSPRMKFLFELMTLVPDLLGKFKVFIGVYQIQCSMGKTMEVTYPSIVESMFTAVRSLANFDAFALPGFSCMLGSSVIHKFWLSALLPPIIILVFGISYTVQTRKSDDNHRADVRESSLNWAFLGIFLIYPSICTNLFTIFHCFTVGVDENGADVAYIMSDFRYQCSGDFYEAHYMLGLLFVLLYPIGIPVVGGIVLLLRRKDITAESQPDHESYKVGPNDDDYPGPKAIKQLYKDYNPNNYMWEVYQLMQKVMLCGLLGFAWRGSLTQASIGLIISQVVLVAFVKASPYRDPRTNFLAIVGQCILVFSFFSTILLKADVSGEVLTTDKIGILMVAVNVSMFVFFIFFILDVLIKTRSGIGKEEDEPKGEEGVSTTFTNPVNGDD